MPARMIVPPKAVARAVLSFFVSSDLPVPQKSIYPSYLLPGTDKVHIPSPAADVRAVRVKDLADNGTGCHTDRSFQTSCSQG